MITMLTIPEFEIRGIIIEHLGRIKPEQYKGKGYDINLMLADGSGEPKKLLANMHVVAVIITEDKAIPEEV